MPRGVTTLEAIIANIRKESKRSPNKNYGKDEYSSIAYLAERVQYGLYWDHDWAFLKARRDITLNAGQRYYDMPADMNFERIKRARVLYGGDWMDLTRGIDMVEDYNSFDSDEDVRSDPAYKWDIINTVNPAANPSAEEQIEIWPIPSAETTVRFDGILNVGAFVSDNDRCTLDDHLIVLFAAAELLLGDERADSQAKLAQANRLYSRLKGGSSRITPNNKISMNGPQGQSPRRTRIIPVYSSS